MAPGVMAACAVSESKGSPCMVPFKTEMSAVPSGSPRVPLMCASRVNAPVTGTEDDCPARASTSWTSALRTVTVGAQGRGVFGLPIPQAYGGGEVGLQGAAREHAVAYGGAGPGGFEVGSEAREWPSIRAEIGDEHIAGNSRVAEFAARGGGDGDASAGANFTGRSPASGRRSTRSCETARI